MASRPVPEAIGLTVEDEPSQIAGEAGDLLSVVYAEVELTMIQRELPRPVLRRLRSQTPAARAAGALGTSAPEMAIETN